MRRRETDPIANVKKVVVTGGPCAGKTTVINYLRGAMPEYIVTVPEVATTLLGGGYPMPGVDLEWSQEWQNSFQDAVFHVQQSAEGAAVLAAQQRGGGVVVADRGLMDGAAYFKGNKGEFADRYGLDLPVVMGRYDTVVHLESIAVRSRHLYNALKDNNPTRFQSYESSLALEYGVLEAWDGHPNRIIVNEHSLDDRLLAVEGIVRAVQGMGPVVTDAEMP